VQRMARFASIVVFLVIGVSAPPPLVYAQAGFEDDRVMIQGFYWESSRHGFQQKFPQFGSEHWYAIIAREAPRYARRASTLSGYRPHRSPVASVLAMTQENTLFWITAMEPSWSSETHWRLS
jgi:hypothetical protein